MVTKMIMNLREKKEETQQEFQLRDRKHMEVRNRSHRAKEYDNWTENYTRRG